MPDPGHIVTHEPDKPPPGYVSIGELTRRCNEASQRMSLRNPNRALLHQCGFAMQQLVREIDRLKGAAAPPESKPPVPAIVIANQLPSRMKG